MTSGSAMVAAPTRMAPSTAALSQHVTAHHTSAPRLFPQREISPQLCGRATSPRPSPFHGEGGAAAPEGAPSLRNGERRGEDSTSTGEGGRGSVPLHGDGYVSEVLKMEPLLRRVVNQYARQPSDASDLLQEVYVKLFGRAGKRSPPVRNFEAFCFQVARNVALDWWRKRQNSVLDYIPEPEEVEVVDCDTDTIRIASCEQELEKLVRAIGRLPPRRRRVFTLRKVYGLSQKEISQQLQISENTVEQHIVQAVRFVAAAVTDLSLQPNWHR
jgi:RNA polymerase sigma factor (sigma-70 family)